MAIPTSISRLAAYYRRNSIGATTRRAVLETRRALFSNRMILFYCDLSEQNIPATVLPNDLRVERKSNEAEVSPQNLEQVIQTWNSKLAPQRIKERFELGASLWLIHHDGRLAGYGWTLVGSTVEPHYFPLGINDVHLFDFYVFPQYRGRKINPLLVGEILRHLKAEGRRRAFIEAAEWNHAQLASLGKTSFHRFARARKFTIFHRTFVRWDENKSPAQQERTLATATKSTEAVAIQGFGRGLRTRAADGEAVPMNALKAEPRGN